MAAKDIRLRRMRAGAELIVVVVKKLS